MTWNSYLYANGNPLSYIDREGYASDFVGPPDVRKSEEALAAIDEQNKKSDGRTSKANAYNRLADDLHTFGKDDQLNILERINTYADSLEGAGREGKIADAAARTAAAWARETEAIPPDTKVMFGSEFRGNYRVAAGVWQAGGAIRRGKTAPGAEDQVSRVAGRLTANTVKQVEQAKAPTPQGTDLKQTSTSQKPDAVTTEGARLPVGARPLENQGSAASRQATDTEGNFVYRGLGKGEDAEAGLSARAPGAGNSEISHVAGKRESQWISTTKSQSTAVEKYGEHGVVRIDLGKVESQVSDVSRGFPQGGRMSNWAIRDQEVLIRDHVPASAITRVK